MTSTMVSGSPPPGMAQEVIISADSHVMEPHDLWEARLPALFRDRAPKFPAPRVGEGFQHHPGGHDPRARVTEMAVDGVTAEVLYPTLGLTLFGQDDASLQEACFTVYNDWLIDYCRVNPERLVGVPCLSVYRIDQAVKELERCSKAGLKGAIVWQAPHPDLPLYSEHYFPLWEAAQALDAPVSLHILTGHNYTKQPEKRKGPELYRGSVNLKTGEAANALFELIFYGILHRYPGLKLVVVENEIGWMPFYLQQWDYYYRRFLKSEPLSLDREPSAYFARQVYATFFNDTVGGRCLEWWGQNNCMWSNDFPHPNSTWPHSRQVIDRDLGHLPNYVRAKLVRDNVEQLYGLSIPEAAAK
ncbi:MAG: amidohydrolase family protein [Chloroflexota bacterium]